MTRTVVSLRTVCIAALAFVVTCCCAPAHAQSVWELTPYRVLVVVHAEDGVARSPLREQELSRDFQQRAEAFVGGVWNVRCTAIGPWDHAAEAGDDAEEATPQAAPDAIPIPLPEGSDLLGSAFPAGWKHFDKVMLVRVSPKESGYQIIAQDYDVRTRTASPPVEATAVHPLKLSDTLFEAVCDAFMPLARVETVDGTEVALRLRAAAIPPRDPVLASLISKDLFLPIVRYDDRDGNPKKISPIPWTILETTSIDGAEATCRTHTGIRAPLSARRRGRVEQLALGVAAPNRPTRLTLLSRTEPDRALEGYEVLARGPDSEEEPTLLAVTGRTGTIELAPHADGPLRVILIRHGRELLARLPILVGYAPELEAMVPDDRARLEIEGRLAGIHEEIVDAVTQREVLIRRIRYLLGQNQPTEAKRVADQFSDVKSLEDFNRELTRLRLQTSSDDPYIARRLESMFEKTQEQVYKHLAPGKVESIISEVNQAVAASATSGQ